MSWKYEIEGVRDFKTEREKMVVETANEYKQQADVTKKAMITVSYKSRFCPIKGIIMWSLIIKVQI